jgi:hypothetical protein
LNALLSPRVPLDIGARRPALENIVVAISVPIAVHFAAADAAYCAP